MRAWTLGMLVAIGCGGGGSGECLEDGTYQVTYTAEEGSDSFCDQMAVSDTYEAEGDELDTECDPSCTCDYEISPDGCSAHMVVTCEESGMTTRNDCEFAMDGDSFSGTCVITVEGPMSLTCNLAVSGVKK
jgi:hypothetical protein